MFHRPVPSVWRSLVLFKWSALLAMGVLLAGCALPEKMPSSPGARWSDVHDDPVALGDWLQVNEMPDGGLGELATRPPEFHRELVTHVFDAHGTAPSARDSILDEVMTDLAAGPSARSEGLEITEATSAATGCDQPVEYRATVVGATTASKVWTWDDPARGREYIFEFRPSWSDTPDDMRWASAVGWVTYCIWLRSQLSGHGIAGHQLCNQPYQLQLGNTVMKAIGFGFRNTGARATYAALYLHHR